MNTTSLNSATGSVLGLAELIGISHGKMRTLIGHLCAAGLITVSYTHLTLPTKRQILHIIKQLTHNAL